MSASLRRIVVACSTIFDHHRSRFSSSSSPPIMHTVPSWASALDEPSSHTGPSDGDCLRRILHRLESNIPQARKVELEDIPNPPLPRLWLRCLGHALTHNTCCRTLVLSGCGLGDQEVSPILPTSQYSLPDYSLSLDLLSFASLTSRIKLWPKTPR